MLTMVGTNRDTGRKVMVLGIEAKNVERLKQGHPIHLIADELGFEGEIIIHYRETMAELEAEFRPLVGPHTVVNDERDLKKRN